MKHLLLALFGRRGCPGAHACLRATPAPDAIKTANLRITRQQDRLTRAERSIAAVEANRLTEQATRAMGDHMLSQRIDHLSAEIKALKKPHRFGSAASYLALFRKG